MNSHPINEVTSNIMEKLTEMTDVNTVIGDPITTPAGVVIIPISKVSLGFGVGGGEYNMNTAVSSQPDAKIPFGGGGGAALTINPVAFLTVSGENVKVLTVDRDESTVDKALAMLPELVDKAVAAYNERKGKKAGADSMPKSE